MMMPKALVTGASGFIGSHLVELLVKEGYSVRALTRYTSDDHRGNLNWLPADILAEVELYRADLRDAEAVADALKGIDTVFHLGAIISIPYSYQHPEETLSVNVNGTFNVLQAMRLHATRRGVIVSTSEVYGTARYVPIDEAHPLQAQSPYSATKIGAEALAVSFQKSFGTPVIVVRPFNTYGPRQSARAIIPTIISQALTKPVVTLGALHPTRDLTYALDTARGLMLAGRAEDVALGQAINLGTGSSVSIGDLARQIVALIGRDVEIRGNDDERMRPTASEVLQLESNNQLAAKLIGWRPEISLDEGLKRTIDWIAAHLDSFDPDRYAI
ncbi:MAG TPA: SDR family NAD(P)-dependent oxidoreductase [Aggregatilineales bacterium]|nr:SDR family NAD(P)-dependent oxidoreductase [Aggregatilineales bacterium]